jgi:hypothetical protein
VGRSKAAFGVSQYSVESSSATAPADHAETKQATATASVVLRRTRKLLLVTDRHITTSLVRRSAPPKCGYVCASGVPDASPVLRGNLAMRGARSAFRGGGGAHRVRDERCDVNVTQPRRIVSRASLRPTALLCLFRSRRAAVPCRKQLRMDLLV